MELVVAADGTYYFGHGDGVVVALALAEWAASVPNPWVLLHFVFLLSLVFGSVCISQISPYSFELRLISRTPTGVWLWVVGHLSIIISLR